MSFTARDMRSPVRWRSKKAAGSWTNREKKRLRSS